MKNDYIKSYVLEKQVVLLKTEKEQLQANVDYLSMMTDIPLPNEEEENSES